MKKFLAWMTHLLRARKKEAKNKLGDVPHSEVDPMAFHIGKKGMAMTGNTHKTAFNKAKTKSQSA